MSTAHDWKRIDIDWYKCAACGSQISALADYAATKFGCAGAAPKAEYTAVDMANAAADGFRDGAASAEALRKALTECTASLEGEVLQKYHGQIPEDMHPVTRRDYDRDMAEINGYKALSKEG